MTRQRPIAGQRSRRTAVLERPVRPEPMWDDRDRPAREAPHVDPLLLVAGLVVAILLVTAGLLTVRARGADGVEQARTQATAAAEATAVDLLSYDYRHLDRDFARARSGLTGGFADDYATTTQTVVRPTATEVNAVVKADVAASSVVRADRNRVVVLLFVNQTTTSTRLDAPKVDLNRVRLTMDRVHGRWLVSKVVAL
jgi:Mce-associated membrane protein